MVDHLEPDHLRVANVERLDKLRSSAGQIDEILSTLSSGNRHLKNILFLTQVIPFPPDAGPKVKTWNVLKYLASRGHEITLVSFIRKGEEASIDELRKHCSQVYTIPIERSRWADLFYWMKSLLSGRPFLVERDDDPAMRSLVQRLVQSGKFDAIHADQLTMTQFVVMNRHSNDPIDEPPIEKSTEKWESPPDNVGPPGNSERIFDAHNAVWTIVQRMRDTSPFFLHPFLSHEAFKIKDYEGMIVHSFDHTLAVSEEDSRALLTAERSYCKRIGRDPSDSSRLSIIPIAVNTSAYTRMPSSGSNASVLTMGTLHYPPNADGIRWFLHEVFPLVQKKIDEATLTIIGKNPPNDMVSTASASDGAVRVTGYVPDLQPYLRAADVLVVPVRAGGGMRVRILEGLAWGIPMVTTSIGLEGIEALPGRDILVEDGAEGFAGAVCKLLQSEDLRSKVSSHGLKLVKQHYDWHTVLRKLDHVYA